ncbi:hypothetical protein G7Y89_g2908 [Cudoniella acicularis]|uniref:Uncharacterized protein n=1 Tax=Cudoniella acicularis TaxID=354080 RepID=A0A8H4RTL1_9HELO|nr:hypothetical protein G7Y89_g2908 [Cudoniella acicularis]
MATSTKNNYFMASEEEMTSLDLSTDPLRIIDSTTVDGTCIQDLQSTHPTPPVHIFVGTDIDPTKFPSNPPVGITYQVQNINKPWPAEWHNSFDFVRQSLCLAAVQLTEEENVLSEREGPVMRNYVQLMNDCFAAIGASNPDMELAKRGVYSIAVSAAGLVGFAKSLPASTRPL